MTDLAPRPVFDPIPADVAADGLGSTAFQDAAAHRLHLKQRLAGAFRLFGRFGFDEGVAGHITARDPEDPERFWVNPFGMSFKQIKVSDLLCVDHDGRIVHGDGPLNQAAFAIHSRVHKARPDVVAAAHAHSVHGKAWSAFRRPLDPLTQDSCIFYGDHGVFGDFTGVVLDTSEGDRIAAALGTGKAAILSNHGNLTVGHSVDEAVFWFITMERTCQAQLLVESCARLAPVLIDPDQATRTAQQVGSHAAGWFSFQPMWDWITTVEPDLFN